MSCRCHRIFKCTSIRKHRLGEWSEWKDLVIVQKMLNLVLNCKYFRVKHAYHYCRAACDGRQRLLHFLRLLFQNTRESFIAPASSQRKPLLPFISWLLCNFNYVLITLPLDWVNHRGPFIFTLFWHMSFVHMYTSISQLILILFSQGALPLDLQLSLLHMLSFLGKVLTLIYSKNGTHSISALFPLVSHHSLLTWFVRSNNEVIRFRSSVDSNSWTATHDIMLSWLSCLICCMVMYYIKTAFSTKGSVLQPRDNQEKKSNAFSLSILKIMLLLWLER